MPSFWAESERGERCYWCGARDGLLAVTRWFPVRRGWGGEHPAFQTTRTQCVDRAACQARRDRVREVQQRRQGRLVLYDAPNPSDEPGHCRWCGEELRWTKAGRPSKRRICEERYEGRKCSEEYSRSYCYDPRYALRTLAARAGRRHLACVDCGVVVEERNEHGQWVGLQERRVPVPVVAWDWEAKGTPPRDWPHEWIIWKTGVPEWHADHDVPLEDGGEHTVENLRVRCVPCHMAKTAEENRARAARRRGAVADGLRPLL